MDHEPGALCSKNGIVAKRRAPLIGWRLLCDAVSYGGLHVLSSPASGAEEEVTRVALAYHPGRAVQFLKEGPGLISNNQDAVPGLPWGFTEPVNGNSSLGMEWNVVLLSRVG
jgi:hypothetical protein